MGCHSNFIPPPLPGRFYHVGMTGFEPTTACSHNRTSRGFSLLPQPLPPNRLSPHPRTSVSLCPFSPLGSVFAPLGPGSFLPFFHYSPRPPCLALLSSCRASLCLVVPPCYNAQHSSCPLWSCGANVEPSLLCCPSQSALLTDPAFQLQSPPWLWIHCIITLINRTHLNLVCLPAWFPISPVMPRVLIGLYHNCLRQL